MNKRTYDRIASVCIITAAASAILFERAGNLSWLVGLFGIMAGVTATVVYCYNQWHPEQGDVLTENESAENFLAKSNLLPDIKPASSKLEESPSEGGEEVIARYRYVRFGAVRIAVQRTLADEVVDIMTKLSSQQTLLPISYELEITPEGRFIVRFINEQRTMHKSAKQKQEWAWSGLYSPAEKGS